VVPSWRRIARFNPRQDVSRDHLALEADGRVVSRTPSGRATGRLLDMNGSPQLELRRELIQQGDYSID